ncbi:hypothetical protein OFC58_31455, partial [Escherichia coli]|nr:hypothetical protein [Escherichia coli]
IQKAELELSQALEISTSQIRARVLEHLAQQKTLNESIADGIVRTYEQAANKIEKVLDKAFIGKVPVIGDIIKTLTRNSLTNITRSLLDAF